MISVTPGRRRAEEFAHLVDSREADAAPRDAALLQLVEDLRATPGPTPRAEHVADLRVRLMAEADTALVPADARLLLPERRRRDRRIAVAAGAAALVAGTSTVAVAAQDALPGDTLYPIKRMLESAGTSLEMDGSDRAVRFLDHALDRLAEVEALAARQDTESTAAMPATLLDFSVQADRGADLVLDEYTSTGDAALVERLQEFVVRSMDTLVGLETRIPSTARDALEQAARTLADIDARARAACPTCAGPLLEIPQSMLMAFQAPAGGTRTVAPDVSLDPAGGSSQETETDAPELPALDGAVDLPNGTLDSSEDVTGDGGTTKEEDGSGTSLGDLTDVLVGTGSTSTDDDGLLDPADPLLDPVTDTLGDTVDGTTDQLLD